ncbi:phospholipase, partial [Actinomadura logoneensis]
VPVTPRPVAVPRAATPVPAAGGAGRAPGTGLLVTLSVFRT